MARALRVLMLVTDAGSGHRSAAQAIEAALLQAHHHDVQVTIANALHHPTAPSVGRSGENLYLKMHAGAPQEYDTMNGWLDQPLGWLALEQIAVNFVRAPLREVLVETAPDVVIGTFPVYTAAVADVYRNQPTRPLLMSVVTDLGGVHRLWFSKHDDMCAVPTSMVRTQAVNAGIGPNRLLETGIPVNPRFGSPRADRAALRRDLGWSQDLPTLLLLGGGAGVGPLEELALGLSAARLPMQLAVVAGRNRELAARLRAHAWQIPVHIYDFVPLPDLMHAADIVASKPGGLSVSEALAAGRPLLLHGAPMAQEAGNLQYVASRGAGVYAGGTAAFVAQTERWLADRAALARATNAARSIGRPGAARQVAEIAYARGIAHPSPTPLTVRRTIGERLAEWR